MDVRSVVVGSCVLIGMVGAGIGLIRIGLNDTNTARGIIRIICGVVLIIGGIMIFIGTLKGEIKW